MILFDCDYNEGAHPLILERLSSTNFEQTPGYGEDAHCENARGLIKALCRREDVDVHFLVGGTQTNMTVISAALRPHQGVVAADTGHVSVHESGAVEATGHKVLTVKNIEGKLLAADADRLIKGHFDDVTHEHMVQPGIVYISHPTESGTLYSKKELFELAAVCKKWDIPLYLDGARLGYGLVSEKSDLTLPDIAAACDAFYIGGTKVGALFGEALVIKSPALKKDFRYLQKQKGGLLAKGRLLGVQFEALFENGLYFDIAKHAVDEAMRIKAAFLRKGASLFMDSYTNQQFPILRDSVLDSLSRDFFFSPWQRLGSGSSAVRFCTSWATRPENVNKLLASLDVLELK